MFRLGTHIMVKRLGYTHHGIYIGNNKVIHYSGFHSFGKKGKIQETSLKDFADGSIVKEYEFKHLIRGKSFNPEEIIRRAKSRLNEDNYNLVFNNCEHFANWCTHGDDFSAQASGMAEHNVRNGKYLATGFDLIDIVNNFKYLYDKFIK